MMLHCCVVPCFLSILFHVVSSVVALVVVLFLLNCFVFAKIHSSANKKKNNNNHIRIITEHAPYYFVVFNSQLFHLLCCLHRKCIIVSSIGREMEESSCYLKRVYSYYSSFADMLFFILLRC